MARGRNKCKIIQVKTAPTDTNTIVNLVELSNETNSGGLSPEVMQNMIENINNDIVIRGTLATRKEKARDYVSAMKQITPRKDGVINKFEDEFIEVQLKEEGKADNMTEVLNPELMIVGTKIDGDKREVVTKKKNKGGKKKKKRDKKRKNEDNEVEEIKDDASEKKPIKLKPIKRKNGPIEDDNPTTNKPLPALKPTGCLGFITTWIAKRKEKRREKKRKAIKARSDAQVESLVEYEHRKTKGGVAFTVEMDGRPIVKSVLPPIKQKPGPIRLATEQKLAIADYNRLEQINKKKQNARAHSRLVREVADRKAKHEDEFKQATMQKIKDKEQRAERASSRLEYARNQRCLSRCASRVKNRLDAFNYKMENTEASSHVAYAISPVPSEDESLSYFE